MPRSPATPRRNVRSNGAGLDATFDFVLNVPGAPPGSSPSASPTTGPTAGPGGTWQAGRTYTAGDTVTYGGATYRCVQGHTAQVGWEPPNVQSLWQRVGQLSGEISSQRLRRVHDRP